MSKKLQQLRDAYIKGYVSEFNTKHGLQNSVIEHVPRTGDHKVIYPTITENVPKNSGRKRIYVKGVMTMAGQPLKLSFMLSCIEYDIDQKIPKSFFLQWLKKQVSRPTGEVWDNYIDYCAQNYLGKNYQH